MLTYGPESYVPGDRCHVFHGQMKKSFERGKSFQILGTMSWARVGQVPVIATRREPFPGEEKNLTPQSYIVKVDIKNIEK